jgi:TolA-binding protein
LLPGGRCAPDPRYPHLQGLQPLIDAGDFAGASQVRQKALERDPAGARADAALFDLALLSVHYGNPKKDYRRSLLLFNRLVKEHPQSPLVDEARIWIGILGSIEQARKIDIEIEEKKKEITK